MVQALHSPHPLLMVDDDPLVLDSYKVILRRAGIREVMVCRDSRDVMPLLSRQKIEVILLDLFMPYISGEKVLSMITRNHPGLPVIVITGNTTVEIAVRCMKAGAFDFLVKPVEGSSLLARVGQALLTQALRRENSRLKRHILSGKLDHPETFSEIITRTPDMHALFQYVESIAPSTHPVLITGETGVGKELMAKAVHRLSGRPGRFITINAAGTDDTLFSDTLFGHVKGAFTGATGMRQGLVAKASGGTLFLDEIGEVNPSSQVKLLRLLQEHEYYPLGGDVPHRADIRLIAATNQDFQALKNSKKFRKDLFYRIYGHHIHIPPLRQRLEDLPLLLNHFLEAAARSLGKKTPSYPPELITLLSNHPFPGNVRELKSMVADAVGSHSSKMLSLNRFKVHLNPEATDPATEPSHDGGPIFSKREPLPTLAQVNQLLIGAAMERTNGNKSMAARLLGISRQRLIRQLKPHGKTK